MGRKRLKRGEERGVGGGVQLGGSLTRATQQSWRAVLLRADGDTTTLLLQFDTQRSAQHDNATHSEFQKLVARERRSHADYLALYIDSSAASDPARAASACQKVHDFLKRTCIYALTSLYGTPT